MHNRQGKYRSNPDLITIKPQWQGTPTDEHGRFVNLEYPFSPNFRDVFKWGISRNPQREEKKNDTFRLSKRNDISYLDQANDCLVWLGHATFFMRLGGKTFLIDPVFYKVPFVKRYAEHALGPRAFRTVDFLLISHDHQDHCQEKTIRELAVHYPAMKVFTGLNMEDLLSPWLKKQKIQIAGWYQQYSTGNDLKIFFLPTRHWSKRSVRDDNSRLWGAFVFQWKDKTIYFGGDSGFGGHYKDAQRLFPSIDVAILGCGAYKPEWFMGPNHSSPQNAVEAFHHLGAKLFIPMHYGTFDLSDEPVGEPYRILKAMEEGKKIQGKLCALDLNEPLFFLIEKYA